MKSNRGTVIVETDVYKDMKARLPILRTLLDVLSLTAIVSFIVCNGYIPADANVLIFLDVILGIFGVFLLFCMMKPIEEFKTLKKFYAEAKVKTEYEFFANGVGMYQHRKGKLEDCEILSYSSLRKKWENKTYIGFMGYQFGVYVIKKSGINEEELNTIRAALGLPFSGKKIDLPTADLKIAPFIAEIKPKEPSEEEKAVENKSDETRSETDK